MKQRYICIYRYIAQKVIVFHVNIFQVPRVLFDGWSAEDFNAMFEDEDSIEDCIETILNTVKVSVTTHVYHITEFMS